MVKDISDFPRYCLKWIFLIVFVMHFGFYFGFLSRKLFVIYFGWYLGFLTVC